MKLGEKVHADAYLYRSRDGNRKYWRRIEKPVTGIYVGYRTYANGELGGGWGYDDPLYFIPKEYFKVALIVTDPRENPIPIMYDDMRTEAQHNGKIETEDQLGTEIGNGC